MNRITLVHGRVRPEERLLVESAERLGIPLDLVHDRDLVLGIDGAGIDADAVFIRSISATRGHYTALATERAGIPTINPSRTAEVCADKARTSLALHRAGVPTPDTRIAFEPETTLAALDDLGYPAVIKPVQGSWARLVHRVDSRREAEQLLEYRTMMANPTQHVHYVQRYIDKNGGDGFRDLRAFVVGDQTIAAIWRTSPHWVTNTARGATTQACPVDDDLDDLCQRAADAVGGGILAIDLMETPDGLTVHEVNHTMEFRNSIAPTGVDIPGRMLQYVQEVARR